jgi:hypothetical protein
VRPEGRALSSAPRRVGAMPSCVGLAGASPAAVSAGAPRSRSRVRGEILSSERDVKGPQGAIWFSGGGQSCGPSMKRTLQPREIDTRKGGMAEPITPRRRQQTAPVRAGEVQDVPGVRRRARSDSPARNRRDPTRPPTSGKDPTYKPSAKWSGDGRESEGPIVPVRPATITPTEGRGPALVTRVLGGKCEGVVVETQQPHG